MSRKLTPRDIHIQTYNTTSKVLTLLNLTHLYPESAAGCLA